MNKKNRVTASNFILMFGYPPPFINRVKTKKQKEHAKQNRLLYRKLH